MEEVAGGSEQTPLRALAITQDNDYQLEQASAAQQAAVRLGIGLQTPFADNDAINQSTHILNVIQATRDRADAILVEPVSRTGFPKVAQAAVAAGIAWVVLNSDARIRGGFPPCGEDPRVHGE